MEEQDSASQFRRRARLLNHLEEMVAAGRVTKDEVERLAAATDPGDFENLVRQIRRGHIDDQAASRRSPASRPSQRPMPHTPE